MNDGSLLRLSLLASLLGLALLALTASQAQPHAAKIAEISYDEVGSTVAVKGQIAARSDHKDGHVFLKVSDGTGKISVPVFTSQLEKMNQSEIPCLKTGSEVEILGRVEDFRGSLEIVPKGGGVKCLKSSPS